MDIIIIVCVMFVFSLTLADISVLFKSFSSRFSSVNTCSLIGSWGVCNNEMADQLIEF